VAALQQPIDVRLWLADLGKIDARRTKQRKVVSPVYQAEMTTIALFWKFIEQEQLMGVYEVRITEWLEATEV
jgi:hypothetical protein